MEEDIPPNKPIWERNVEIAKAIPAEERKRLPPDSSQNLDHYLYGVPRKRKKPEAQR
jgi:hypothetical protein